eukprot:s935_g49.t1
MPVALRAWQLQSSEALNFDATPLIMAAGLRVEGTSALHDCFGAKKTGKMKAALHSVRNDRRPGFFEALVTEAKLARVVFVADSSFGEASILGHLKDRPERLSVFQVQDVPEASVRRILQQQCGEEISEEQLRAIGGRYMDISAMLGHMRHGVAASEAVRWLLETAEVTVRRLLLTGQPNARWTRPQLWRAICLLESSGRKVPYDVVLWNESNLIAVNPRKSETSWALRYDVEAGSPLYAEVFRRLVQNEGLKAVLDLDVAREQKTIDAYEAELVRLEEILDARRDWWFSSRSLDGQLERRVAQLVDLIMEQHKMLSWDVRRVKNSVLAS